MALPRPPLNPASPIPNNSFYSLSSNSLTTPQGPLIVGTGITIDYTEGVINAGDGGGTVVSVSGVAPISVVTPTSTPLISIAAASTTGPGAVQLYNDLNSPSTTLALTAAQGKLLQDQISSLVVSGTIELAGTIDASTGLVNSVTSVGVTDGYATGAVLPAASAITNNTYVIVTTPGTMTPPGGVATAVTRGDWFLVSEVSLGTYAWTFLNVGFDAPYATDTIPGIVCLSTNALAQAGTDTTTALTPASAASVYIPKSCVTAKGIILTGTAASTPSALTVGTNGQVLLACSTAPNGICWGDIPPATPTSLGTVRGCTECGSVSLGCNALIVPGSGLNNVAIGNSAMCSNTGGYKNIAIGVNTLCSNTTAYENVAVGAEAMKCNITGTGNIAVGTSTLYFNTAGINNVAIGHLSSVYNTSSGNTFVGTSSGFSATNVFRSVAVGESALNSSTVSQYSVALGWSALAGVTTGGCNTAVGGAAGNTITSGNYNVAIGANVQVPVGNQSSQLAIGWEGNRWLTGDSGKHIQPGAGIRDCTGSLGTAGQTLTTTGGAVQWASSAKGYAYALANGASPFNVGTGITIPISGIQSFQLTVIFSNIINFTVGKKYLLNVSITAATSADTSIVRWVNNIGQVGPEIYIASSFGNRPLSTSSSWIYAPVAGSEAIQLRVATSSLLIYPYGTSVVATEL